jgi:hypothetical protein
VQANWTRRAALVFVTASLFASAWFGLRTYGVGMPLSGGVRAWMTLRYVAATYRVPEALLTTRLGLTMDAPPDATLKSLAERASVSPFQYVQRVQQIIADVAHAAPGQDTDSPASWLA